MNKQLIVTIGISKKLLAHKESVALLPKQRQESESSEGGECSTRAPSTCLEEVSGVQPEIQKTPRKIDGIKGKMSKLFFKIDNNIDRLY